MTVLTRALAQELVEQQGLDVVIPNIYTSISDSAFERIQLASIDIPDSVTSIGSYAFYDNKLTSVIIPDSITSIGEGVFMYNQLTSVFIPDSVISIDDFAFNTNKIASVIIPDSVTSISDFAFNMNKIASVIIPDSVTSIGAGAFYDNQLTNIEIGDSVILIDSIAFKRNQLTHVIIPDSVTSLGTDVFKENPSLESISIFKDPLFDISVFPEDIEINKRGINNTPFNINISDQSFYENITADSAVATLSTSDLDSGDTYTYSLVSGAGDIDNDAFTIDGDQLKIKASPDYETQESYSVRLQTKDSAGLTYEKSCVLTVNDLGVLTKELAQKLVDEQGSDVVIPDIYASIGDDAFSENEISSIEIGSSVKLIGNRAFYRNKLTSVVIPDGVNSISDDAFSENEISSVEIGSSVKLIGNRAFYDNKLTSIVIPDSVTSIGNNAFGSNPSLALESITPFDLSVLPEGIDNVNASQVILPDGVSPDTITKGEGVNSKGDTISIIKLEKKADGISAVASKDTSLTGKALHNSTVEAQSEKGETIAITADTHTKNTSITNTGKGALVANLTSGKHKNLTISSTKKKVNDNVNVSNGVKLENSTIELGKGDDSIIFGKKVKFKGKHSIDLGKEGKGEIIFKADDVAGINMTVTSFTKKDSIEVGDETFTYKDIKNGSEIPGITVELA